MKIVLINGSSTPLYEQIKNAIKDEILQGKLSFDEQLPSVRELSAELGVSILTVKKAYDELAGEGFIIIRQGLGTFVAPINESLHQEERQKELEKHLIEASRIAKLINTDKVDFLSLAEYIYRSSDDE
ncbi:MAG: winged helix-turn-helix transcriptional regulator [Clostridiales bacterium]|nr:winged helix-turn-helix transcriptional regulator [Clostridiales bacterium]